MWPAFSDMSVDETGKLSQFSKTKLCKFFVIDLRNCPDLRCTKFCQTLIQTGHCTSSSCTYAHTQEELRSTGAYHKTKMCRFIQTGHCALGAKCNFAHSEVEMPEPETIAAMLEPPPGLDRTSLLEGDDEEEEQMRKLLERAKSLKPSYVQVDKGYGFPEEKKAKRRQKAPTTVKGGVKPSDPWQSSFGEINTSEIVDFEFGEKVASYAAAQGGGANPWLGAWTGSPMPGYYSGLPFGNGFGGWDGRQHVS